MATLRIKAITDYLEEIAPIEERLNAYLETHQAHAAA